MNNIYEDKIVEIERKGKQKVAFAFLNTSTLWDVLHEFDLNSTLKKYNSCFKDIAFAIREHKELE